MQEIYDFVIVGSGGGSMCAALVMRQAGKRVLIAEKTDLIGGSTARSGGVMWIPNNRFMAEDGVEDSTDLALTYMEATAGRSGDAPGTSPERRRVYVEEAPKMVDFLVAEGIKLGRYKDWPDYYDERPGGSKSGRTVVAELFDAGELGEWRAKLRPSWVPVGGTLAELFALPFIRKSWRARFAALRIGLRMAVARLTGRHWVTAGAALQGRMLKRAVEAGVAIHTGCAVQSFIVEAGEVKGVEIVRNGRAQSIHATLGVLVNAGGFAQNQAMRSRYMPGTSVRWTAANPGDTGEMLQEMMRLGAATGQLDEMVGNQMVIPPGVENENGDGVVFAAVSGQMDIAKPHSILVDRHGERYMNECGSYMQFCQTMLRRDGQVPAIPSWWIFDTDYIRNYGLCGTLPGTRKPDRWFSSGFLKRGDTIEELARALAIEPDRLTATVEQYNRDVDNGSDSRFHRGKRAYDRWLGDPYDPTHATLGKIAHGPFYAAPVVPGDVGTFGGVVTDCSARVLREDGSAIGGLYATGNSTASVMGRSYPGAGSSIGPSFTWGYVAARHALASAHAR